MIIDKILRPVSQRTAASSPLVRRITGLLLFLLASALLATGCASLLQARPSPVVDRLAPYRLAMLPEYRSLLDELGPLPEYNVRIRLDPDDLRYRGQMEVRIPPAPEGSVPEAFYFRLYPNLAHYAGGMRIDLATVNGQGAPFSYLASDTAIQIAVPPSAAAAGQPVTVGLQWTGKARSWPDERYSLFGQGHGVISLPLAYPILAVQDSSHDGGWNLAMGDVQGDAAFSEIGLYQATITVPAGYSVVSTGAVRSVTEHDVDEVAAEEAATAEGDAPDARQWMDWQIVSGPVREFAVFVSDQYHLAETKADGVRVNSWYLPGDDVTGRAAAEYTAAALRIYNKLFGAYPYNELDVVAGPLNFRGMEYPGLFELGVDLYRKNADELEFRIAHEAAHQWWYNLVGNDPVHSPWLDEGLAEFSTYFYTLLTSGQERADRLVARRWEAPYNVVLDLGLDAAADLPVDAYQPRNYETIIYGKAALFHNELRKVMGDAQYLDMLRDYARRYRFRVATSDDLVALLQEYGGSEIMDLYERWILRAAEAPAESEDPGEEASS